ncbi:hypothetical protein GL267_007285 [Acidithiobacillus ferrianus]|uniref:Uncharacterized protein n=2 Tax=Acidithiobacillus ferrianus TaxID=2678518 RepID=A0A845U4E7_9PROT|nr:hypothetical protein [Acidithiobacillus ferrianus]NDU42076.1 hypothetical protein [Acidithiobacillus ferrianus]
MAAFAARLAVPLSCRFVLQGGDRQAAAYLTGDEKMQAVDSATVTNNDGTGINSLLNVINEPGLYSLIPRGRKPGSLLTPWKIQSSRAKAFQ